MSRDKGGRRGRSKRGTAGSDRASDFGSDDSDSVSNLSCTTAGTKSAKGSSKRSHVSDLQNINEDNNNLQDVDDILDEALSYLDKGSTKSQKLGLDYLMRGLRQCGGECFVFTNTESIAERCYRVINKSLKEEYSRKAAQILGILCLYELKGQQNFYEELKEKLEPFISEGTAAAPKLNKTDTFSSELCLTLGLACHMISKDLSDIVSVVDLLFETAFKASKRCIKIASNVNLEKASKVTCSSVDTANLPSASNISASKIQKFSSTAAEKCAAALQAVALIFSSPALPKNSNKYGKFLKNNSGKILELLKHSTSPEIRNKTGILLSLLIQRTKQSSASEYDGEIDSVELADIIQDDKFLTEIEETIKSFSNINEKSLSKEDNKSIKGQFGRIENSIFENVYDDKKPINISTNKYKAETIQFDSWEKEIFYEVCQHFLGTGLLQHLRTNKTVRCNGILGLPAPTFTTLEEDKEDLLLKENMTVQQLKSRQLEVWNDNKKVNQKSIGKQRRHKQNYRDAYED